MCLSAQKYMGDLRTERNLLYYALRAFVKVCVIFAYESAGFFAPLLSEEDVIHLSSETMENFDGNLKGKMY